MWWMALAERQGHRHSDMLGEPRRIGDQPAGETGPLPGGLVRTSPAGFVQRRAPGHNQSTARPASPPPPALAAGPGAAAEDGISIADVLISPTLFSRPWCVMHRAVARCIQ